MKKACSVHYQPIHSKTRNATYQYESNKQLREVATAEGDCINRSFLEHQCNQLEVVEHPLQSIGTLVIDAGKGRINLERVRSAEAVVDVGVTAHQVTCCVASNCPLRPMRRTQATLNPPKLLEHLHIDPERLDAREKWLVNVSLVVPQSAQSGHKSPTGRRDTINNHGDML